MRAKEWLEGSPGRGVSPEALKYGRAGEESPGQRAAEAGLGRKGRNGPQRKGSTQEAFEETNAI